MDICLDSNVYILAFGDEPAADCEGVTVLVAASPSRFRLRVPRLAVKEIGRNLVPIQLKRLHNFWRKMGCSIDEEEIVPIGLIKAYRDRGLKSGDSVIAAYCDHLGMDALISENRDFLAMTTPLPFRILKAAEFLREFK